MREGLELRGKLGNLSALADHDQLIPVPDLLLEPLYLLVDGPALRTTAKEVGSDVVDQLVVLQAVG